MKLDFSDPLLVSANSNGSALTKDAILITFNDTNVFIDPNNGLPPSKTLLSQKKVSLPKMLGEKAADKV
jgi:hypothetical protein